MSAYLGLDLTASPFRSSGFAVLGDGALLLAVGWVGSDQEILALADRWQPCLVAIDAPLSLPAGLCCLEESCACQPQAADGLKAAERDLIARGFGLFRTGKRSIIKDMVYRAVGLRRALEERGWTVIEVYPYASKVALWGKPIPRKTRVSGRIWLRDKLAERVFGLREHSGPLGHDQLDALVGAYTAYLYHQGRAAALGDPAEGLIYLPLA